ncbi:MAG: hypothetical protein HOO67_03560 [Candidatus Peribacteraceae bacterium]|nr:hypothetical protein [Candidatus Peribacteraceae bacterium]
MMTLPELLSKTFTDCNRAGKTLGTAILIVGGISVVLSVLFLHVVFRSGAAEIGKILGPEEQANFEQYAWTATTNFGMQRMMDDLGTKMEAKFDGMTDEEQRAVVIPVLLSFASRVVPLACVFALLSILISLWQSVFFLLVAARGKGTFGGLSKEAFGWMLPMLGLNIIVGLLFIAIPVIAVFLGFLLPNILFIMLLVLVAIALFVYFGTRFALSSAILIQDRTGVVESIRRSFVLTSRGKFLKVFGNLLGAGALIGVIIIVFQIILTILSMIAEPFPPAPFVINQVLVFVALVGQAFIAVFTVRLKEAVAIKKRA